MSKDCEKCVEKSYEIGQLMGLNLHLQKENAELRKKNEELEKQIKQLSQTVSRQDKAYKTLEKKWFESVDENGKLEEQCAELRKQVNEYEGCISWDTTCKKCADLLDKNYEQYCEIEKLEAKLKFIYEQIDKDFLAPCDYNDNDVTMGESLWCDNNCDNVDCSSCWEKYFELKQLEADQALEKLKEKDNE